MQVSIITVTLNPGKLLQESLSSITTQDSEAWEVIVQDGGSTDGSFDEVDPTDRVRLFQEKDSWIYDAMNRALSHATGDYLLFLNAGDCLSEPELLSKVVDFAERSESPDLSFEDYRNLDKNRVICLPETLNAIGLFRAAYCHQAIFFARSLFRSIGQYDTSFQIRADLDFLYRCHLSEVKVLSKRRKGVGVLYEGAGFSADPSRQGLKAKELERIRRKYMPTWQRILFRCLHELTLVRLRNWMFSRSSQGLN